MDLDLDPNLELELDLDLNLGLRLRLVLLGSAWLWLWLWLWLELWVAWVSGGLEWPGIRRRLVLVELDDGSGGLAGWAFVEGAGGGVEVVSGEVEVVSGGGSGCDVVEVAFGFDLAADANSAGNGVLLAAMPQAYSILLQFSPSLEPQTLPRLPGLSFFLLRGSGCADGWYYSQQTPPRLLSLSPRLSPRASTTHSLTP